ncbi:MAG: ribonuclease Z [Bacteroidota bacterium]
MSFSVTILGSGAALPTGKRNPTSQYIFCNNRHILIDCGEGTQMQLRKFGIPFQRITHIFISHLHGDHFFGLPGLLSTMNLLGRNRGVTLYGPPQLKDILTQLFECGGQKLMFKLNFVPTSTDGEKILFEDKLIEIKSFPLRHRIPTTGFRIQEKPKEFRLNPEAIEQDQIPIEFYHRLKKGESPINENGKIIDFKKYTSPPNPSFSYAYCSDTAYYEELIPFIKDATLLYHEATFTEKDKDRARLTFHSTAQEAAQIAMAANVKKLILGHLSSRYLETDEHHSEASAYFKNTTVAEDGMKMDLMSFHKNFEK